MTTSLTFFRSDDKTRQNRVLMWPYMSVSDWVFSLAPLLKCFPEGIETKEAAEKGQSH